MHRVSVIIPVYNAGKTIREALDSVLAQTYRDFELIIVNDGSTDDSDAVIHRYITDGRGDITCVAQKNKGAAAARNAGIRIARGELIAFLDADDLWDTDKLKTAVDALEARPEAMMVFSDMRHSVDGKMIHASYLHERGYRHVSSGQVYDNLLKENFIFTPTVVMRKSVFATIGYFDESLKIAEDYDLWLRVARDHEVLFVDRPLVTRRRLGANITENREVYALSAIRLKEKLLNIHRDEPQRLRLIAHRLTRDQYNLGYILFNAAKGQEARQMFFKTVRVPLYSLRSLFYIVVSFLPEGVIQYLRRARTMKGAHG